LLCHCFKVIICMYVCYMLFNKYSIIRAGAIFAISRRRPPTRSAFDNYECHVTAFRPISEAGHTTKLTSTNEICFVAIKHILPTAKWERTLSQWLARPPAMWEDPGSNYTENSCVYRNGYCDMQSWAQAAPYCSAYVDSGLHPFGVAETSTSFSIWLFFLLLAILYDHMFMYVGLFGHSAVVFHVFMFFSCFCVLRTLCVVVFFQWHYWFI